MEFPYVFGRLLKHGDKLRLDGLKGFVDFLLGDDERRKGHAVKFFAVFKKCLITIRFDVFYNFGHRFFHVCREIFP